MQSTNIIFNFAQYKKKCIIYFTTNMPSCGYTEAVEVWSPVLGRESAEPGSL